MASPGAGADPGLPGAHRGVSGTVVAFDFGEKRIGIAVGETATGIASPLGSIDEEATAPRLAAIARIVGEWRPVLLVVGMPRHAHGGEHAVGRLAGKFARRLRARFGLPVVLVDETLTSATAQAELRGTRTRGARAGDLDAAAARIILQSYLDEPAHGRPLP